MIRATQSSEARNRDLENWYFKIQRGEIKLPRFQRFEAWDRGRITNFLKTIIQNLPVGISLILEVGDSPQFIDRYISTADPLQSNRVTEHLLDGQQRLTALWRAANNNFEYETYYLALPEYCETSLFDKKEPPTVYCVPRYYKIATRYPLWADSATECLKRGLIPFNLLKPVDISNEIDSWISSATLPTRPKEGTFEDFEKYTKHKDTIKEKINSYRECVKRFNLPFLALDSHTEKSVALQVFINMNTNSQPLTLYDLIVAEVENIAGKSLHTLQKELDVLHPHIKRYHDLSSLILSTSALMQNKHPNLRGMTDMDKNTMLDNWDTMSKSLDRMARFLESQGVIDSQRLPTNAVLAVIAALYKHIPEDGDELGRTETILKKYIWSSFFSDRYENSAASRAYMDYLYIKAVINKKTNTKTGTPFTENDIPALNRSEHPIANVDEIKTAPWPKNASIIGRAILAVSSLMGSLDFADGQSINPVHIQNREYHHIYPDALLKEAQIDSFIALNCALITWKTNRNIARKDPYKYLEDRYQWTDRDTVKTRLHSHLIPIKELEASEYEKVDPKSKAIKIKSDFELFITKRAQWFAAAASKLSEGQVVHVGKIIDE